MTVRRIVTGVVDGRSVCVSDDTEPRSWWHELWTSTPADPLGSDPAGPPASLEIEPGGTALRLIELPPNEVVRQTLAQSDRQDIDDQGFHRTRTLDYVMVLDGPVELVLDDGSVEVQPGDLVVQRSTMHAWRNHNQHAIRLLAVMVGLPEAADGRA